MYTFALDINNNYHYVASLKTTYPQDFRNLWYPGSHISQWSCHKTRWMTPFSVISDTMTLDVCCWYFGHYVHTFVFRTNNLATIYSLIPEWLSEQKLTVPSNGWTTANRDMLVGSAAGCHCYFGEDTHFCIGQQYHNLPYLSLTCITLGYAYFKEMNTLQIDLSRLQFWLLLLFWRVDLHLTQKSNLHPLSQALCLPLNHGPSTELGLSGLFEQDTHFALHTHCWNPYL